MSRWIWEPSPEEIRSTNVYRFMRRLGFEDLEAFLRYSTDHLEEFWDAVVQETGIQWSEGYTQVLDASRGPEWARWFLDGKLNINENCLHRHTGRANPAIIWEGEDRATREISFAELQHQSCRLANYLRACGVTTGDRVAVCMPMVPEVVTILYACFEIGAVVVPVFSGFGPGAIASRIENSGARLVFTADFLIRRGKRISLREKVDEAIGRLSASAPPVVEYRYGDGWGGLLSGHTAQRKTVALSSEAPAMILYTSGTTGKPKGTVHTHAGTLAQTAKEIWLAFDHRDSDRFFWLSDIGWMMGPWTILGNHNFGGTIFLYDGAPDHPGPDRLWQMIERHRITTFGISPTAVRLLMRSDSAQQHAMQTLRLLGSTGEPWDDTSYSWFFEHVGKRRRPIINISGGTEIVGCFLFPLPIQPLKPCTLGGPAPGMATEVVNERGEPVRGEMGYLVCRKPAPSMTRGIWGDPERYKEVYWSRFPGMWFHGDWASVDADGCWFLHGRADESMNVSGRKIGPAELEDALLEHPAVSEAAVIGVPDELKGEAPVGFVVLKPGYEWRPELRLEIEEAAVRSLGAAFRPRTVQNVPVLPKTQSGKIVRRLMRQAYLGEPLGDASTVDNAAALEAFRKRPD